MGQHHFAKMADAYPKGVKHVKYMNVVQIHLPEGTCCSKYTCGVIQQDIMHKRWGSRQLQ